MLELDNVIYFDNDNDFFAFSVKPEIMICDNTTGCIGYDIDFTDGYKNAISNNKKFCIKDENSKIYKHNCVSYKLLSKDVLNLEPYFAGFTDKKINKKLEKVEENGD